MERDTMKAFLVCTLLLLANEARASCLATTTYCFCRFAGPAGLVETKSVDGPVAEVELLEVVGGLDAGTRVKLAREADEVVGGRWLLMGQERRLVSDAGTVGCVSPDELAVAVPVVEVKRAVGNASCDQLLEPVVPQLACNDTGRACSTSGLAALLPLLLLLARRRRRE
jgi:hypothetical protein